MTPILNRKVVQKTILVFAIILLHVFFQIKKNQKDKTERNQLAKQIYKQEVETRKKIFRLENEISEIKINNSKTQKRIEIANQNYHKIIFTIKKLNNEKLKTDNKILNASDSSDWNWFTSRFPKYNNKLSVKTNKAIRKSGTNRQPKSYKTSQPN